MRKALTGFALVAFVTGVALVAVSLSQAPSAIAQETEREFFFQPVGDVLDELVDDGVITNEQRDKIAEAFEERVVRFGKGLSGVPHLEIVADVLDIEVDDLAEQLKNGATIADIAGDKTQDVIDALIAEHGARIDEAVADEKITEERAEELRSALAEKVEAMVSGEQPLQIIPFGKGHFHGPRGFDFFRGPRGFDGFGFGGGFGLESIADTLGLEVDELMDRLTDGTSLADLAEEQGVEIDDIVDALLADIDEKLADLVADERLTQERADAIREQMAQGIESLISGEFLGGFEGLPEFGMRDFLKGFEIPEDFDGFFRFHGHHDRFHDDADIEGTGTSA